MIFVLKKKKNSGRKLLNILLIDMNKMIFSILFFHFQLKSIHSTRYGAVKSISYNTFLIEIYIMQWFGRKLLVQATKNKL